MGENGDSLRVVSYHAWRECPCDICKRERERRSVRKRNPILRLSIEAAILFGFIPRRSPHGSLSRNLRIGEKSKSE